jgi:hypothetical protein
MATRKKSTKKTPAKAAKKKPAPKKVKKKAPPKAAKKKPAPKKVKRKAPAKAAKKKPVPKKAKKKAPVKADKKKPAPKKAKKKAPAKAAKKKAAPKKISKKAPAKTAKKKPGSKKIIKKVPVKKPVEVPVTGAPVINTPNTNQPSVAAPVTGAPVINTPNTNQPSVAAPVSGAVTDFVVSANNPAALFTLKVYRGERMALLAMNWANGKQPPDDFIGFAIEYQEPGANQFFPLKNRISFLKNDGNVDPAIKSTMLSPIQKFRWVHFPFHPDLPGNFIYRVKPVFMDANEKLSYGEQQEAAIQLANETYPGILNIGFTRGFVASQRFVDSFGTNGGVGTIIPVDGDSGLEFTPNDPKAAAALDWMGFEARSLLLGALDDAIQDPSAQVRVLAYDLNVPEIVDRFVKLGNRLRIIIDDSDKKADTDSPETKAAAILIASAGPGQVQRQHMGGLQHNKTIAVKGDKVNLAIGGSTNMSWRGLFVQNNNVVLLKGAVPAQLFFDQFDNMWKNPNKAAGFGATASANWNDLKLPGITAKVAFSPHIASNAILNGIAEDISGTSSSLFYSLAFLYQTKGVIVDAIKKVTANKDIFVYGMSDKKVGGLDIQSPDGNPPSAFPATLLENIPEPFKQESSGGKGIRLHHKFVIIDVDKPTARVYTGSYNFSKAADNNNGENLLLIQDRRVAVSYMIQAITMFDHYEFRDAVAKSPVNKLFLKVPPKAAGEKPWWDHDYTDPQKARDRELFS